MINGMWTADRRVFLDANGKAVDEKDPSKVELLIAPGQKMEMAKAVELGLVEQPVEPKAKGKAPAANADLKAAESRIKELEAEVETLTKENADLKAEKPAEEAKPEAEKAEDQASDKAEKQASDKAVTPDKNK